MRAGPLSRTDLIELLDASFVSTWVLAKDLPAHERSEEAAVRDAARLLREAYQYPVDVAIMGSDLTLRAHASAEELLAGKARLLPLLRGVLEAKSGGR